MIRNKIGTNVWLLGFLLYGSITILNSIITVIVGNFALNILQFGSDYWIIFFTPLLCSGAIGSIYSIQEKKIITLKISLQISFILIFFDLLFFFTPLLFEISQIEGKDLIELIPLSTYGVIFNAFVSFFGLQFLSRLTTKYKNTRNLKQQIPKNVIYKGYIIKSCLVISNIFAVLITIIGGTFGFFGFMFCDNPSATFLQCLMIPGIPIGLGISSVIISLLAWIYFNPQKQDLNIKVVLCAGFPFFVALWAYLVLFF